MGLDEALLRSVGAPPTLRFYTWAPDALSLGYFQAFEDVPAAAAHPSVVRRLTGGGAIHHDAGELTFSIAIDADDPAYRGTVPESYERCHRALIAALDAVGVERPRMRRGETAGSDVGGTGLCFHLSTDQDIGWRGDDGRFAKGVGTAQRRSGGRVLHHGSIKVERSPLETRTASLRGAGSLATRRELVRELVRAFRSEFGVELPEPSTGGPAAGNGASALLSSEHEAAGELGRRYSSPEFVQRVVRRRASRSRTR